LCLAFVGNSPTLFGCHIRQVAETAARLAPPLKLQRYADGWEGTNLLQNYGSTRPRIGLKFRESLSRFTFAVYGINFFARRGNGLSLIN
jgi:hypothetical protein